MMTVKKIANKPFHNGNRLNGNGASVHAKYGVFQNGQQVGFVVCNGVWDAYSVEGKRINSYSCSTLAELKTLLAR
jgi:hypothetical protein